MRRSMTLLPCAFALFSLAMGPCNEESLGIDILDGAVTDPGPMPTPNPGSGGAVSHADASGSGGAPGTADGGPPPVVVSTLPTLDVPCFSATLTGRKLLERTRPSYATLLWGQDTGITDLTITVSYADGAVECTPGKSPPPGSAAPVQPPSLSVAVRIGFKTTDGAFNETFDTKISGYEAGGVTFSHAIPRAELTGSYDPNLPGYSNVVVSFSGSFTGADTEGNVGKGGQQPGKAPTAFPFALQWPQPQR